MVYGLLQFPLMLTESDFIRSICSHPHDDAPRLLYCDWLQDRNYPGDAVQADELRNAIEGKPIKDERRYYRHVPLADRWPACPVSYRRGFIDHIMLRAIHVESANAANLLATIFRNHPVVRVTIIDADEAFGRYMQPIARSSRGASISWTFNLFRQQHRFDRLPKPICDHWPTPEGPFGEHGFATEKDAHMALSAAVVNWGRSLADLPEIQTYQPATAVPSGR